MVKTYHSFLRIVTFLVLTFIVPEVYGEEKVMTLGGKDGWPVLSRRDGVVMGKGRFGYDAVKLDTNSRKTSFMSDLLLDFEGEVPEDACGNYSVILNEVTPTSRCKMGKKGGLIRENNGLRLRGNPGSIFGSENATGSFEIEFWLYPFIAENGEIVFSWRSSRTVSGYSLYQIIRASFYGNRLQWVFTNVFDGFVDNSGEVSISSYRTIIPNTWAHHAISYNQDTGLLEYRINGELEALKYMTTTGKETGGSVYMFQTGVTADIDICPQFSGVIDDFHISRQAVSETLPDFNFDTYRKEGGRFETQPILISQCAKLTRLDAIIDTPEQTDVVFFVRSGDNFFSWTENYPEWIPVTNHEEILNTEGLYFQIAADLYSDGGGKNTPSVTQIDLHYVETPAPLPPFNIKAVPSNGSVTLTWSYSIDNNAGGYYVYYGERPGEYLGREAVEGASPVDAGNITGITLTGLKNGKIYYFAVAAYSKRDSRIMGDLSKEVYARPLNR
ncbi:hypothetical protein HNP77_001854 [Treponema rectale]|uniref:Fibronectin type-III domain-containing protein n=1 Tax=Treponema rectale TaxID=744512 RepID=A0A840SJC1_9SPIR|nr:LamG-like jellyroll fold domain-containing protein [Treponema rectale]MBB5219472.1 hypothetical protein [Treponema rectale]